MSEECLDRIETELGLLRTDVNRLQTGQDDLRREMRVLHEDVISTIKATSDPMPACERMIKASSADLREEIGQRLDPLEAIVRKHFGT